MKLNLIQQKQTTQEQNSLTKIRKKANKLKKLKLDLNLLARRDGCRTCDQQIKSFASLFPCFQAIDLVPVNDWGGSRIGLASHRPHVID